MTFTELHLHQTDDLFKRKEFYWNSTTVSNYREKKLMLSL